MASVTDGCEPITSDVAGRIALVDRGLCGFVVKAANAQAAGASALIIANTLGRPAFGMAGVDPTVTIATIGISNQDGDLIKAGLPGVSAEFFIDPSRLAGTTDGYVRLYAPRVVEPGSSISHFDTTAAPNLLMEPFITDTLRGNANLDLTPSLMVDVGWNLESLKIGSCDTGVANALPNGAPPQRQRGELRRGREEQGPVRQLHEQGDQRRQEGGDADRRSALGDHALRQQGQVVG